LREEGGGIKKKSKILKEKTDMGGFKNKKGRRSLTRGVSPKRKQISFGISPNIGEKEIPSILMFAVGWPED